MIVLLQLREKGIRVREVIIMSKYMIDIAECIDKKVGKLSDCTSRTHLSLIFKDLA